MTFQINMLSNIMEIEFVMKLTMFYIRLDMVAIFFLFLRSDRKNELNDFINIFRYSFPVTMFLLMMLFFVLPFTIYDSLITIYHDYKQHH